MLDYKYENDIMVNKYFNKRDNCPACHSKNTKLIYSKSYFEPPLYNYLKSYYEPQGKIEFKYLKGVFYTIKECNNCKTIFQEEIPNDFLLNKIYDEWIDSSLALERRLENDNLSKYSYYAKEVQMIIAFLNKKPADLKFLDFGMGWGRWCRSAKGFGVLDTYGYDLSEERADYTDKYGVKTITKNEISNNKFDFINTEQVVEHVPKPLETIKFLQQSLKKEGLLKISVPNCKNVIRKLLNKKWKANPGRSKSINPITPLEHINGFRRESIIKMADLAGLEVAYIPIWIQLTFSTNWFNKNIAISNIAKPFYNNVLKRGNYLFFKNKF